MKKILAAAVAIAALMALTGCKSEKKADVAQSGKVLNIYVWNTEFQERFNTYYAPKLPADVKVNWIITPNQDNAYQNKLDEALMRQDSLPNDEKIDLFLVEADYALKYVNTDFTLDVIKDLGITQEDIKNQYKYTKDIMTDSKGNLKGLTWQACPGGFIYRRSIAKDVLGTDNPDEVGKALSDWQKFNDVAKEAKKKGYFMLSGYDDAFRAFSDNMTKPWVVEDKIIIDPQIESWIAQTKEFTENGYNNKASLWSAESTQGMGGKGKVFGYFGPAWFIDFVMAPGSLNDQNAEKKLGNGSYGDWAFCKGPQGFSWGGTWICGAKGSDNIEIIRDILKTLTCDAEVMTEIAKKSGDFTNNIPAMEAVAASDYQNPFLGGQNHIKFFLDSAKSIDKSCITQYDQGMSEKIQSAMKDYFNGKVSLDQAWANFYTSIQELYPRLKK
ncbi:MAG: carbohydrate ABC transporter substrate-binding protein [Treponema sp.]|uniref:carbohydrate ABC transporter substrate-binding protein n=1 Tax=Treponema sp. TaxID=166 RepID=UPI0025D403BA|nr:carbohydrate ABC transporter substrate-binding protein [Treponema sp.]MBQ8678857.1 carbohydrate ABC transporter substrate-binding protein [Treponema sp.]